MPSASPLAELNERLREWEADRSRLFGGDHRVRDIRRDPQYNAHLAESVEFLYEVQRGRRPFWQLQEAMSSADFPSLMGDILDRMLLGTFQEWPSTWPAVARRRVVADFRQVKSISFDADDGTPLSEVEEYAEYPETSYSDAEDQFSVQKFGRRVGYSWESMINDDLDAFMRIPEDLARRARQSEDRFATSLYVDANGPHATLYTVGQDNIITGDPALSIAGLQTGFDQLATLTDPAGDPIVITAVTLVVPPQLEIVAQNILNAISIDIVEAGGTANQTVRAQNWMRGRVTLEVNPWIPILAASANGATSWFLFAAPSTGRPALEMGFLRGNETPALFQKMGDNQRVGGGAVPESFENDSIDWRVRHVFGGQRLINTGGWRSTVASNGGG